MSDASELLKRCFNGGEPVLALAPMQAITDLPFWKLLRQFGGADIYYTEYFRVYPTSLLDKRIARSILENPTGRPVVAQMIGSDVGSLVRTAQALQRLPIAGVDLNLGCPAPVVYRKCAGGGLLRDLGRVDEILSALREVVTLPLSVKTRLGFATSSEFDRILEVLGRHPLDGVVVHGRTLKQMYTGTVDYDRIGEAVRRLDCPVLANGDIWSAEQAERVLKQTGARGVMLGRGAVRNPWLFDQIRMRLRGQPVVLPTGREVLAYVHALYAASTAVCSREEARVARIKKHMNFLGRGVDSAGQFLHQVQRVRCESEFFRICHEFLDHSEPMALVPSPPDARVQRGALSRGEALPSAVVQDSTGRTV